MALSNENITRALTTVDTPDGGDLVTDGALRSLEIRGEDLSIELSLSADAG
ncbi:MAG TPA: DUF59 domain-containing protein, partial [Phycisphaerales bacterium]|nr:DUF59 domain-containing protein [Phycisphaerales bacterium]